MTTHPTMQTPTVKLCRACKSEISFEARKCKECSEEQQWTWKNIFNQYVTWALSVLSLVASGFALYQATRSKESAVGVTVHHLKLVRDSDEQDRVDIYVVMQVRNDGDAAAYVELFCKYGGCAPVVDVTTHEYGPLMVKANDFRMLEAPIGSVALSDVASFEDDALKQLCDKAINEPRNSIAHEGQSLFIGRSLFLEVITQLGDNARLPIIVDPQLLFATIRAGKIESSSIPQVPTYDNEPIPEQDSYAPNDTGFQPRQEPEPVPAAP